MTFNAAYGARPGDIAGNTTSFPFRIALFNTAGLKAFTFFNTDFIICDHNTATMTIVFSVEEVDGVQGRTATGKEIYDKGIGLFSHNESNCIKNGIHRFRKGKSMPRYECPKHI